jgi:two-component system, NarL family, response regulator NreC
MKGNSNQLGNLIQPPKLSKREHEVLPLLAKGHPNKIVASILGISTRTAEVHRASIMRKLGLRSISDLVLYAVRNKIIDLDA